MSILSPIHSAVNRYPDFESLPCAYCQTAILVSARSPEIPVCNACRRMQAEQAAHELLSLAKAMRAGEAPFDILTAGERREQIHQLIDPAECCRPDVPVTMRLVRELASEVCLPDEPIYDSGGYEPTAEEREEIEGRIEASEFDPYFDELDKATKE